MTTRLAKRIRLLATLLAALALMVPTPIAPAPAQSYVPATLNSLNSVEQFRDAFNADKERPRLVLLLSPT